METVALKLPQVQELVSVARAFCHHIDFAGKRDLFEWLRATARLLPRIHASIAELGRVSDPSHTTRANWDDRFELFNKLKDFLGESDHYPLETGEDEQDAQAGSLAEDFTHIYFELKHGLDQCDQDPTLVEQTLNNWSEGFYLHWGWHLMDAERQLYRMCFHRPVRKRKERQFGQFRGKIHMSDDFDDALPDSFWLGEE